MDTFRATLRRHREARRWSEGELSRRAGIDRSNLSRVENGHRDPSPRFVARVAHALGLGHEETTTLHLAAGHIPPGIPVGKLRLALTLVREASEMEIAATRALIAEARRLAAEDAAAVAA